MKKIQNLLSTMLLSLLLLCTYQTANAQHNQYQMNIDVSILNASGQLHITCDNPVTIFNRVDFVLVWSSA